MTKASDNIFPRFLISEGGSTATPGTAEVTVYAKSDGLLYSKDDGGTETPLGGGGGGGGSGLTVEASYYTNTDGTYDDLGNAGGGDGVIFNGGATLTHTFPAGDYMITCHVRYDRLTGGHTGIALRVDSTVMNNFGDGINTAGGNAFYEFTGSPIVTLSGASHTIDLYGTDGGDHSARRYYGISIVCIKIA